MTSSNGNIFRVTGPFCGEFTKASDAELWCFFICAWVDGWVNNREAGDLRCYRAHYDVTVIINLHVTVHCWLMGKGKAWDLSQPPTNPTDQVPWEYILYGIWFLCVSITWTHFHGMTYIVVHLISTWEIQFLITVSQIPICNGSAQ